MKLYSIKKYSKTLAPLQTGAWWRHLFFKKNELTSKDILCSPKRDAWCTTRFRIIFKHYSFYTSSGIIKHQIKDKEYIEEPHTAIFIGQTKCGKTHLILGLIEKEYNRHFDYIIIICLTLR